MSGNAIHQLLGAYLLGGLEAAEARAFEDHLAGCAECRRELEELESLPALLDAVPAPDAVALTAGRPAVDPSPLLVEPAETLKHKVLDELAARRRTSRRRRSAVMAGVAAACLALGFLAGPLLNQPPKPDASYSVQAGSGLQLTVGMVKKTWGTELEVDGRSMPLEGTLYLWVKGRDGAEELACGWTATPSGRIKVTGATPVQLAGIAGVELRDEAQRTVAAISVP
ncbi:zf-HC2 domain-containing protein [Arthrobacter sp. CJ23]|uniref:zf-HC2 domain-containing protein n=1 Tax=Arthrobacter sp. CJ23 TaxID=2972479 RepID=UPI00215C341A|nr:zf-HC2 domain-containing protein [Arthrobacter sp. CJ23]UVJ39131.1 zf-HC2 domain-containing protein [Arthrobacter sp. CJ23]